MIMKRNFLRMGTLVLSLAALIWATIPIIAKPKGHGGGGHGAPAHVGSVHFGGHPGPSHLDPRHFDPAVHGTVRSEHFERWGGYRNPYRDDYIRHFRPGFRFFILDGAEYYGYYDLLPDCQTVVVGGVAYYLCDGVYYLPYIYNGQTVYMVVPPPV
jgi:hypothetical protein